jgi:hypothetical protein
MNAGSPAIDTSMIELEIAECIAAGKIRLRFDRSALRLVNGLKATLADVVPVGQAILLTIAAPIKRRANTAAALETLVRGGLPDGEVREVIHDNHVRLLRVINVPAHMPKVVGFVHNPESDAGTILALARSYLVGRN